MSLAEFAGPEGLDLAGRAALVATAVQSRGRDSLEVVFSVGLMKDPKYGLRVMAARRTSRAASGDRRDVDAAARDHQVAGRVGCQCRAGREVGEVE